MLFSADETPFLDAILARPEDDELRLVYADYLDETGRLQDAARAELIRVQIALARLPAEDTRRPHLIERQAELLHDHITAWTDPVNDLRGTFAFRRGIPDSLSIDAADFLARSEAIFHRTRITPGGRSIVRRVYLRDPAPVVSALARCPSLARIEELNLYGGSLGNDGVAALARSPFLDAVRILDLGSNGLDDTGVSTLTRATTLPRLQSLMLNDNRHITSNGAGAIADSPFLAGLRELDLSDNDITEGGVRALVQGRTTTRLQKLHLAGNPIGDGGLAALIRSDLFARLLTYDPHLDLRRNTIGPDGASALAASLALARLVSVNLDANYLTDPGALALVASGRLTAVRTLRLSRNQLTDATARVLATSVPPELRILDLSGNRLTRRGVDLLTAASEAHGFDLDVSANGTVAAPLPVPVGSVVDGVLSRLPGDGAELAELKRRIAHPTRPSG